MTKQQLKDYGETIGVKLNLKNKKDELIAQLNEATQQQTEQSPTPAPTEQAASSAPSVTPPQSDFDVKKYLLPIVIVLALLIWLV